MKRVQIIMLTLLLALFGMAGCKNKSKAGKSGEAHAAPAPAKKAPAATKPAAAAADDTEEPTKGPPPKTEKEKLTGVYAAACELEPETKDKPGDIPTVTDFEEEVAAKITALNLDAELKLVSKHIFDLAGATEKKEDQE